MLLIQHECYIDINHAVSYLYDLGAKEIRVFYETSDHGLCSANLKKIQGDKFTYETQAITRIQAMFLLSDAILGG